MIKNDLYEENRFVKFKILGLLYIFFQIFLVLLSQPVFAQKIYRPAQDGNSIVIKGTSNLHDWELKGQQITGDFSATIVQNSFRQISQIRISIPVISFKNVEGIMDANAYEALKSKDFPTISYQSNIFTLPGNDQISSVGQLTIAGVTKKKTLITDYVIGNDGSITFKGTVKLKMSEFGISPSTALPGTLDTKDDMEIYYEICFK